MSQIGFYLLLCWGFSVGSQVDCQAQLLLAVEQASVESLNLAMKKSADYADEGSQILSLEPRKCQTTSDCATEYCCGDLVACCLPTRRCGCLDPETRICGWGPLSVMANNGKMENKFGTMDQLGAVACVQKGELRENVAAVSLNLFHTNLIISGDIQQQVDDYMFQTKFYGRVNSEDLVKSLLSRVNGKEIVAHLNEDQVEDTVFEAIKKSAENLLTQFSGKEILDFLTDLQLDELFQELKRRRKRNDVLVSK